MLEGPNSRVSGTITADPLLELPVGSTLALVPVQFPPLSDGLHVVREWTHFGGALLQVGLKSQETFRITGSAVVVGPSVAVLAKHVIEGEIAGLMTGTLVAYFTSIAAHGLEIWQSHQVRLVNDSDLALVTLRRASPLPPDNILRQAALAARTPEVGARIMIVGFRAGAQTYPVTDVAPIFEGNVLVATGTVSAHYPNGRDRSMLPGPCLEISVNARGGMSGGPAFDDEGRLVGILSSSFEHPDGLGPSYVSLLQPALSDPIEVPFLGEVLTVNDLAARVDVGRKR